MKSAGWTLGGETSGHIICLDRISTGDGIIAALQVLAAMQRMDKPSELKSGMTKHPQLLRNVRMATKMDPSDVPQVREAVRDAEAELGDNGCSFAPPGPNLWFASWSRGAMRIRCEIWWTG